MTKSIDCFQAQQPTRVGQLLSSQTQRKPAAATSTALLAVRLEMQVAISVFIDAFPDVRLTTDRLDWQLCTGHRWLECLRLVNLRARA